MCAPVWAEHRIWRPLNKIFPRGPSTWLFAVGKSRGTSFQYQPEREKTSIHGGIKWIVTLLLLAVLATNKWQVQQGWRGLGEVLEVGGGGEISPKTLQAQFALCIKGFAPCHLMGILKFVFFFCLVVSWNYEINIKKEKISREGVEPQLAG